MGYLSKTKRFLPLLGLISSSILATLFFRWALSTPPYEELHAMLRGNAYYASDVVAQLPDSDEIIERLSPEHKATLYLHQATIALTGQDKLKHIRHAIQADPENIKSYDILYNFIEHIPIDFGIPSYLNKLYTIQGIRQEMVADISYHRFEMFSEPERQQRFLAGLSSELKEALSQHKLKSLKDMDTQIRRNE